jgi:hypothetical protein
MKMSPVLGTRERLQHATALAAVLDAAYDAFEQMLLALRAAENPASGLFAAFVMAAASAADGRDTVAFAPSLPPRPGTQASADGDAELAGESAEAVAESLAALTRLLTVRLARAGASAPDPGDRAACADAAWCAEYIYGLLHSSGP